MRCDGSPDPAVQPEINTFISLWREDSETHISKVLENCALALQVRPALWICCLHGFKSIIDDPSHSSIIIVDHFSIKVDT